MATKPLIALITGANTGLGLEIAKSLSGSSSHKYTILMGGRSLDKATAAADGLREVARGNGSDVVPVQIDIEDDASIEKVVVGGGGVLGRVDVLVNNAGTQLDQQWAAGKLSQRAMWDKTWSVNVTSTQTFTYAMIPLLLKSADPRLLFITSGTSTLAGHDNLKIKVNESPEKGWPKSTLYLAAYRSAKTGMNMMMLEWDRILKADGVKVWCVSPGMLATSLGVGDPEKLKAMGAIDPAIGAGVVRGVIEGQRDAEVGQVVLREGTQPW